MSEVISFKRPEIEDRELVVSYYEKDPSFSCERSFANTYLWSRRWPVEFAIIEDALVFHAKWRGSAYAFPIGEPDAVRRAVATLIKDCNDRDEELIFYNATRKNFELLDSFFPDLFTIEYNRDMADYIYDREALATLAGKKYHGKRNHIKRFKNMYPDWSYETISEDNIEDCFQMAQKWRKENGCEDDDEKNAEMCVALNALRLFRELHLTGGLIRTNGQVVAFCLGERLNKDTFVVHFEKALANFEGAYPMINQQFVIHECDSYQFINREEDTGSEGLRKSKLSYRPVFLEEKGLVKRNRHL